MSLQHPSSQPSTSSEGSSDEKNLERVQTCETNVGSSTLSHSHHQDAPTVVESEVDTNFVFPGPPPLNWTVDIRRRKQYIAIFFALLLFESGVLPLILFYALRWGAHLSITTNLAIITSLIGTVSGLKITQRTYNLLFKNGHESRRPIGASRYGLDAFQILISIGIGAFFLPLIIGSSLTPASVATVAMALPCFMLSFCIPLLLTGIWDRHLRVPFRVSSLPRHELLPPLTYTITEDVIAVDGGGKLAFRQAWRHRYEASRVMRSICRVTAVAWGSTGCVVAAGLLAAAWTAPTDTAYGLGYGIPWIWAIVMFAWTVWYVRAELKRERDEWESVGVHKEVQLHLIETAIDREVDQLQRMRSIASTMDPAGQREIVRLAREARAKRASAEVERGREEGRNGGSSEKTHGLDTTEKRGDLGLEDRPRHSSISKMEASTAMAEDSQRNSDYSDKVSDMV